MAKSGAKVTRKANPYYKNGKYYANKQGFKKSEKDRIEKEKLAREKAEKAKLAAAQSAG